MNKLIFEIGNTGIKGCYGNENIHGVQRSVYSKNEFKKYFKIFLGKFPRKPDTVYISTQNSFLIPLFKKIIFEKFGNLPVESMNIDFNNPIKVLYSKMLGFDRYYAAAGAYFKFNSYRNILVIDMGTATTFNLLTDGNFKGGMIAPGVPAATGILSGVTTLPVVKFKKDIFLVNSDTKNAINSGILFQQKYFIEKAIISYRKINRGLLTVITGGGYKYLLNNIEGIDVYEKNLVLEGINYIINWNHAEKE